jgi:hypothetical protein
VVRGHPVDGTWNKEEQRKVRGPAHDTVVDGIGSTSAVRSTYDIFCVEISAEFEKRARDGTIVSFTCVMKRRFSGYPAKFHSHTTQKIADGETTSHTFCATERERTPTNLGSRIGISAGLQEQLHDREMTLW